MNWAMFSVFGYLSVVMSAGVVALWLVHWRKRTGRRLVQAALLLAVAAFALAKVNSVTHVGRIEVDQSEQQALIKKRQEERRQAAVDARGDEVADVRFAEDADGEFLDHAGMDEADRKYLEHETEASEPAWKAGKKERGSSGADDDSLESQIDGEKKAAGMDVRDAGLKAEAKAVVMSSADRDRASRLDGWNLAMGRVLIVVGLLLLATDYLRRTNIYSEETLPLPLPGPVRDSFSPRPAIVERIHPPRREVIDELEWLARRGESFVFLTGDAALGTKALEHLATRAAKSRRFDVLRADVTMDDAFVFEALWFNRASFVVDSSDRVQRMLTRFNELMNARRFSRAKVRQTAHIVWDIPSVPDAELVRLAGLVGFSIFLLNPASNRS